MRQHLGKFDAEGFAFAKEALEAAGIEYGVRSDSLGSVYSPTLGRAVTAATMYDLFVEEERLSDAKIAVDRWLEEAAETALRESGAPPPDADELAKDAEWEQRKRRDRSQSKRPVPMWPLMIMVALGGILLWYFGQR